MLEPSRVVIVIEGDRGASASLPQNEGTDLIRRAFDRLVSTIVDVRSASDQDADHRLVQEAAVGAASQVPALGDRVARPDPLAVIRDAARLT